MAVFIGNKWRICVKQMSIQDWQFCIKKLGIKIFFGIVSIEWIISILFSHFYTEHHIRIDHGCYWRQTTSSYCMWEAYCSKTRHWPVHTSLSCISVFCFSKSRLRRFTAFSLSVSLVCFCELIRSFTSSTDDLSNQYEIRVCRRQQLAIVGFKELRLNTPRKCCDILFIFMFQ